MYCNNCGKSIPDGSKFCTECGMAVTPAANSFKVTVHDTQPQPAQPVQQPNQYGAQFSQPPQPKKKKKGCLTAIIVVVALLIVLGIIGGESEIEGTTDFTSIAAPATTTTTTTTTKETTSKVESKEEYISSCLSIDYESIARNPDKYDGKRVKFTGKVVQVSEGWFDSVTYRVNVTKGDYDIWEDTVYVTFAYGENSSRVLENDIITFYGDCKGVQSYISILGSKITVPAVSAEYIDIQ